MTKALPLAANIVIVPRNTWRNARVNEPSMMLSITPGAGTVNAERPDREVRGNV